MLVKACKIRRDKKFIYYLLDDEDIKNIFNNGFERITEILF